MRVWAMTDGPVKEGKYLVVRRDGTIPPWPHFVLAGVDPAAPAALLRYAAECRKLGLAKDYTESVIELANEWIAGGDNMRAELSKQPDPDAGPHRVDNHFVIGMMRGEYDLTHVLSSEETGEEVGSIASKYMTHKDPNVRKLAASALTQRPDRH